MFGKPFTLDLQHRFGWAGVATWIAFLCACKRSRTPGTFRFLSEADARGQLGILGWDLVDNAGDNWTLEDFWLFTGRKKQTRRTRRGREMNVTATHWEHWQKAEQTLKEQQRQRRWRAQNRDGRNVAVSRRRDGRVTPNSDSDSDSDISTRDACGKPPAGDTSRNNGDGSATTKEPLVERLAATVPGRTYRQALRTIDALRADGIADNLIDEVVGFAADRGDVRSLSFITEVARDWMTQRDPGWRAR